MAGNESKRQKRLMKKRRKDKERRQERASRQISAIHGEKEKIQDARAFPVHECLISDAWREQGFAVILLARRQPDSRILFGFYYVDIFCLGLKNTFCKANLSDPEYERIKGKMYAQHPPVECPLPLAHAIIYGGIHYARRFGFKPNEDFRLSRFVLEEEGAVAPWEETIEFGEDGKPFFIAGPDDNVPRIMRQLAATAGEGNFTYLYGVDPT